MSCSLGLSHSLLLYHTRLFARLSADSMIPIDRNLLISDLAYRVSFDRQFIEFTKEDVYTLNAAAPLLLPIITDT
jgi:hypothetical protein